MKIKNLQSILEIVYIILSIIIFFLNMYFWSYFVSIHPFHMNIGDIVKWYDIPNFFVCVFSYIIVIAGVIWAISNFVYNVTNENES